MLILSVPNATLWSRYRDGEAIERTKAGRAIRSYWERARLLGADPSGPAHATGVSSGDLAVRRDRAHDVVAEGTQLINGVTATLASQGVVALLTDSDGVVLLQRGGGKFETAAVKARLVEGARWDEGTRGTNAIGTALTEGKSVGVIGAAHFEKTNHGLFCYATPIKDPLGRIVGILDVSGKTVDRDEAFALSVHSTAAAVERILNARAYTQAFPGGLRLLESMLERCAVGAVVIEHPGAVKMINDKAAVLLGTSPSRALGKTCEALLGYPFATLRDEALHPRGRALRIEGERLTTYAQVEPLMFGSGVPFAVLVYLEPDVPFTAPKPPESSTVGSAPQLSSLRGSDPQFALARKEAERLTRSAEPFLVLGDPGTGKKRVARSVHLASNRRDEPFLVLNASTAEDADIVIFGKGGKRAPALIGQLEAAAGGTLYIDDVERLPKQVQTTLGRALGSRSFQRLGESAHRQIDARVVFASALSVKDLLTSLAPELQVAMGPNVLTLPRVRDRGDKVELALATLMEGEAQGSDPWELDDEARALIANHPWNGNLGELVFVMHEAKTLGGSSRFVGAREVLAGIARWNARSSLH